MKELTTEEKARRYDEAIEKFDVILNLNTVKENGVIFVYDVKKILPELKESNGEKIRKYLIDRIISAYGENSSTPEGIEVKDIIDWLEKQKRCYSDYEESELRRGLLWHLKELQNIEESKGLPIKAKATYDDWIAWLEKQGKQDNNEDEAILHRFSFYSYKDEPNILYLAGLYVNEEYRNKGIGTKILEVTDEVAKNLNCHTIRLKTKKDSNAERLYRTHGYNSLTTEDSDEIWLEKQGKSTDILADAVLGDNNDGLIADTIRYKKQMKQKPIIDFNADDWYVSKVDGKIKKQGEQKSVNKAEPKFKVKYAGSEYNVLKVKDIAGVTFYGIEDEPNHIDYIKAENCEIISGYGIKENGSPYPTKPAVFSEQKSSDKVEPKFKVGDWVVYHRNDSSTEIMNVYDIRDNRYYFNDNIHFSWSVKECDEKCHIWTIEDAKDGDVLVTGNKNIFIFKSISDCTVYDYCGLYFGKFFEYPSTVNGSTAVQLPIGYTPATKEQCDLLFQKMKEAGHEWDAEKKELKKFDQKSVFEMKTPEESLGIDSDTYNKIVDECVYGEQKPAWSEEDEETLGWLCTFLKKYGHEFYGGNEENVISWLESLKNRYTWKPSDEQLKQLNNVFNDVSAGWEDSVIESLYNDLKKLMEE